MKLNDLFVTSTLVALVFGLVSCGKNTDFYNPNFEKEVAANTYNTNFVAKYGPVSADANWDFSSRQVYVDDTEILTCEQPEVSERGVISYTRTVSSAAVETSQYGMEPNHDIQISVLARVMSLNEISYIRAVASTLEVKPWTDEQIYGVHDLWVWYCHGFAGQESQLASVGGIAIYSLGIHARETTGGTNNDGTEYFTSLPVMGNASKNGWYYGVGNGVSAKATGKRINTTGLKDKGYADLYWYAMVYDGAPQTTENGDKEFREKFELKSYKECVTPNGAVYWLFDCNHDGDYTDLVCLVEPVEAAKRYMVEDLGATDDFDFNDIVVDVRAYGNRQWAVVKAMGGTLDFTLTIGNTTWTKSEHNFTAATMYNTTGNIDYNAELAVFDVTGWVPTANNVSVSVKGRGENDGYQTIPFPKTGEIPMIIAENPARKWMGERVSVPAEWFTQN